MLFNIKDDKTEPIIAGDNASNPSYEENFQSEILIFFFSKALFVLFNIKEDPVDAETDKAAQADDIPKINFLLDSSILFDFFKAFDISQYFIKTFTYMYVLQSSYFIYYTT